MAEERFAQDLAAPENPDQSDSGAHYVLGKRFGSPTQPGGSCIGADWRCPNNAPAGSQQVALWALAGGAPIATSNTFVGSVGIINRVLFVTPFTLVAGAEYIIGVQTNRYVYTNTPAPYPATSLPGGYLSAPSGNGRLVGTTAGVLAFPSAVSGSGSSYHITPVVVFGVDTNAALAITLPKPVLALNGQAISAASLGITLPKPVHALNGAAIAGANLGRILPSPEIALAGDSLPENLREYVWRLLSQDATMNALGINAASLYGRNAPDSPAKDQQLWGVLAWGQEEATLGRDTTSRRRFLVLWVYCRDNDYLKIEPVLHRARALLYPLKAVNHSGDGWVTEVGDGSLTEDLYEPVYEASAKGLNLTIVASGT